VRGGELTQGFLILDNKIITKISRDGKKFPVRVLTDFLAKMIIE
jgi:hypothetical protein